MAEFESDREPVATPAETTPTDRPIATTPVGPPPIEGGAILPASVIPPQRPRGLARWGIALGVLAVMVGAVSIALAALASGGGASAVEGWLPANTIAYLEVRADMPGDQRAKLGNLLAKFPGFADQASNDAKIDEAFDKLLEKSGVSWTKDLKPWLGGEIGFAVTKPLLDVVAKAQSGTMPASAPDDGYVVLVGVKDAAAASAWVGKEVKGTQTTETYGGGDLTRVDTGELVYAFAVRKNVLVLGPVTTVKAVLDTGGAGTLPKSDQFAAARKTAPDANLGFAYLDLKTLYDALMATVKTQASVPAACLPASALASAPAWSAGVARAEDGALVFTSTMPTAGTPPTATGSPSAVAAHLPGSTVAAFEVRGFGSNLVKGLDALKTGLSCDPATAETWTQIDQALGMLGGPDALIGWAGDTALAVTAGGSTFGGGLAAVATDESAAKRTLTQLKTLLALGGAQAGIGVREDSYGAASLMVLTLPSTMSGVPEIAATVTGGVFALGTIDFVKAVVDTKAGASLADDAVYKRAIEQAGGDGIIDTFVDIAGLRTGIEAMLPADQKARYETDIKPFVVPFEAFAGVNKAPGTTAVSHAVITFTK